MANDYPKACRERRRKYINSLRTNALPTDKFGDVSLEDIEKDDTDIEAVEREIELSRAHTKSLETKRDDMNKASMQRLDYAGDGIKGDRRYGPDSALYEGCGYKRESEKKRGGGRKKKTTPTT